MGIWRKILRALIALAVATVVVTYAKFWLWRADVVRELEAHSAVVHYMEIGRASCRERV